ncbi:MAG: hypothetical protein V4691_09670, partial [Pseudomonadota bacterium]
MNYIDASTLPLRNTGQIRLHGPEGFAGMRKAGQLASACLDLLVKEAKPGVTTQRLNDLAFQFALDHEIAQLPRRQGVKPAFALMISYQPAIEILKSLPVIARRVSGITAF